MSVFRVQRRVEFCDTDMAGIVHFANFFRYMEFAEVAFLRSLGLNVKMEAEGRRLGFPRVAASCDYLKPARFEDVLDIALKVERLGTKSATYAIEISCGGEVIARGKVTSACCDVGDDKRLAAIPIPKIYRERVEAFAEGS
jgi:acyl-CoA thioester hydrolase